MALVSLWKNGKEMRVIPSDVKELKKAPHETRLNHLRYHVYRPTFVETQKNHPRDYRLLDNAFKSRMNLITKQEKI